jgi:hypothetical protein
MKATLQLGLGTALLNCVAVFFGIPLNQITADEPKGPAENKKLEYHRAELVGWKLQIRIELKESNPEQLSKALELLERQLDEIVRVVPGPAVEKLRSVPLWLSPVYPNEQPRAEYHPGAQWLKDHGRDPAMEKGVEFSNIEIFDAEFRRMPNFALHELAHAYHDQFIERGFSNPQIEMTYRNAKRAGIYDRVEQRFGDGRSGQTTAYALTNPAEYFAESTEAFFSTNDFYPFTRKELESHDPAMTELLGKLWK